LSHHASPEVWSCFNTLPAPIREQANKSFTLLKGNPQHQSLHFKKVGHYHSARVSLNYRALRVAATDGIVWFWIGTHADYDKLIG
jgi:hypothetical protein